MHKCLWYKSWVWILEPKWKVRCGRCSVTPALWVQGLVATSLSSGALRASVSGEEKSWWMRTPDTSSCLLMCITHIIKDEELRVNDYLQIQWPWLFGLDSWPPFSSSLCLSFPPSFLSLSFPLFLPSFHLLLSLPPSLPLSLLLLCQVILVNLFQHFNTYIS